MLLLGLTTVLAGASAVFALPPEVVRLRQPKSHVFERDASAQVKRSTSFFTPTFSNPKAADFHVNSSTLPLVTFPLQDSWAGRLPISNSSSEDKKLFFWYWPSSQDSASDSLTIWLNGGPGCSSLGGFLQENGPISFQPGDKAPKANPHAWTTASDVLWVEQPVGTGFSIGTPTISNESELSDQFYGFLQQFYATFPELATKKLFITGESYAGFYIPYIATRIVDASDSEKAALPLDLQGLLINDGVYSSFIVGEQAPVANFSAKFQSTLGFSDSQIKSLQASSESCGFQTLLDQITYPPKGKISLPNGTDDVSRACDLFDKFYSYASEINKCFDIYRITDKCPTPDDPMPGYYSRSDVQEALHVPNSGTWSQCSDNSVFVGGGDDSEYSETLFPHLLGNLPRGMTLWHGLVDAILFNVGDRLTIQNLTWGGLQGFQTPITTPLVVGGAEKGVWHSERNLTYIEVDNAGHMIETDQPEVALHVFQTLLGQTNL